MTLFDTFDDIAAYHFHSELAKLSNLKLDDLKDKANAFEDRARNEEASKIISWISPISFRAKHDDILDSTEPGTGTWLLEHGTFQSWIRGDIDKLWCPGIRALNLLCTSWLS